MKKYELNLAEYDFEGRDKDGPKTITVDMKEELSTLLRVPGVYDNGIEICDGIEIVRQIKDPLLGDSLEVDENELTLIKKVLNKLIQHENFKLGGIRHEEMIMRVFKPESAKKKDKENADT